MGGNVLEDKRLVSLRYAHGGTKLQVGIAMPYQELQRLSAGEFKQLCGVSRDTSPQSVEGVTSPA